MESAQANEIYVTLLSGTLIMFLLACGLIFAMVRYQSRQLQYQVSLHNLEQKHQKDLLEGLSDALENERARFARDVHDELGAALSLLRLQLARIGEDPDPQIRELTVEARNTAQHAVDSVRRIAHDLLPPGLELFGFGYVAGELCRRTSENTDLYVSYRNAIESHRFGERRELLLYRILNELLANTVKHARAKKVDVELSLRNDRLIFSYADDGSGFAANSLPSGLGLKSIESRVQLLGGKYLVDTAPGKGFRFTLDIQDSNA